MSSRPEESEAKAADFEARKNAFHDAGGGTEEAARLEARQRHATALAELLRGVRTAIIEVKTAALHARAEIAAAL